MTLERRLVGAQILRPEGMVLADLCFCDGLIRDTAERAVDLSGYYVLPGIVDAHGDGFERQLAPRRGAMSDLGAGLRAVDGELAANGITTAMLAQFFSWEGGMRGPDFAEALAVALDRATPLVDMHLQLRLETHMLADYARAEALIAAHDIGYVVLNDHLPHRALAAGKRPPRLTGQALKGGRSPEAHLAMLQALHDQGPDVADALAGLTARLCAKGVLLGSHDDHEVEDRLKYRAMGVAVSEFPETPEAARTARDGEDAIVLGAPNVVRGGSHAGKVSASDLVAAGCCDALASDYHYPTPRQAAFALMDRGILDLADAWRLVSEGPARLLGFTDRGRLVPGQRADLVILNAETRAVEATIAAGRIAYLAGGAADRFLAA